MEIRQVEDRSRKELTYWILLKYSALKYSMKMCHLLKNILNINWWYKWHSSPFETKTPPPIRSHFMLWVFFLSPTTDTPFKVWSVTIKLARKLKKKKKINFPWCCLIFFTLQKVNNLFSSLSIFQDFYFLIATVL